MNLLSPSYQIINIFVKGINCISVLAESASRQLYLLVMSFNQNRHRPFSDDRTREGDNIAFKMRELAPDMDDQFDVVAWLQSDNSGKRLAAVEFLDWKKDTEYFKVLLERLFVEKPFTQFHILIVLNSMLNQLNYSDMKLLRDKLNAYDPEKDGAGSLWSDDLKTRVEAWFQSVN